MEFGFTARHLTGVPAALALLFAPMAARAQSCSSVSQQRSNLQVRMAKLVAEYPGTHMVIGMCAASAADSYERTHDSSDATSSFAICAGIGCALVGFQNCADIATQWFQMAMEDERLRKLLSGC